MKTIAGCAAGIALMVLAAWQRPDSADDFRAFYRGATLMAAHERVYSHPFAFPDKHEDRQFLPFIRIPSYAAALLPFTALPYKAARNAWIALSILACFGCVWLVPSRRDRLSLALAFSFPLAYSFVLGQDIVLVLLIALAAARIYSSQREFAAGLTASLLAIKVSYLPAVALVFLAKSRRGSCGVAIGVAIQLAVSFALQGMRWPFEYLALLRSPMFDVEPRRMLSIRAVAASLSLPDGMFVIGSIGIALCLWFACSNLSLQDGMTIALPLGLIASPHSYVYDAVVLIPLLVAVASLDSWGGTLAWVGLTPLPYLLLMTESPACVFAGSCSVVVITLSAAAHFYKMRESPGLVCLPQPS